MEDYNLNEGKPWKRETLLIVDDTEYMYLLNNKSIEKNSGFKVLPISCYEEFNEVFTLIGTSSIKPGMLLVQSPINLSEYFEVAQAKEELTINFVSSIIRLSNYLGARKVDIKSLKIIDKQSNSSFTLDVETDTFKVEEIKTTKDNVNATIKRDTTTNSLERNKSFLYNLKNRINVSAEFDNHEIQKELAFSYLKAKHLDNIGYVKDLYEMRTSPNPLKQYNLTISTTTNLQSTFDLISQISFPTGLVKSKYKDAINEKVDVILDIKIDFKKEEDK